MAVGRHVPALEGGLRTPYDGERNGYGEDSENDGECGLDADVDADLDKQHLEADEHEDDAQAVREIPGGGMDDQVCVRACVHMHVLVRMCAHIYACVRV